MQTRTNNQVYAGFFVRLAAYLVDWLVVGVALLAVRIPIWFSGIANPGNLLVRDFIFKYSIADIVTYLLTVSYFVLLTYYTGRTLGKRLLQLKVISAEERQMTFFEVAYRETVGKFLSGVILGIGYLLIGIDREKRGIHDLLADTKVIYFHEKKEPVQTPIVYKPTERSIIYPENQKNYYRNSSMPAQNRQGQPGHSAAGVQGYPGNGMGGTQEPQGQPGRSAAGAQGYPGNGMGGTQEPQGQPGHSAAGAQGYPGNGMGGTQEPQGQPGHSAAGAQGYPGNGMRGTQEPQGQPGNDLADHGAGIKNFQNIPERQEMPTSQDSEM